MYLMLCVFFKSLTICISKRVEKTRKMCWDSGDWQNLQAQGIQLSLLAPGWQKWHVSTKKDQRGPKPSLPAEDRIPWKPEQDFLWSPVNKPWHRAYSVNDILDLEIGFVFPEDEPDWPPALGTKNQRLFNHYLEPHLLLSWLFLSVACGGPDASRPLLTLPSSHQGPRGSQGFGPKNRHRFGGIHRILGFLVVKMDLAWTCLQRTKEPVPKKRPHPHLRQHGYISVILADCYFIAVDVGPCRMQRVWSLGYLAHVVSVLLKSSTSLVSKTPEWKWNKNPKKEKMTLHYCIVSVFKIIKENLCREGLGGPKWEGRLFCGKGRKKMLFLRILWKKKLNFFFLDSLFF